ncbi:MAG: PEP-CTERM sorting domain-containing protein [Alphaproteobacteria bacterium]|nr:PEP-CTERM sorting domain-containing protein [Alphaproteobacteria bacterium]
MIFIIGSDVVSFHEDVEYINPVMDQMGNFGPKNILFLNDFGKSSVAYTNGNVTFDFQPLGFLNGSTDLSAYSAVYVDSPGGCCSDAGGLMDPTGSPVLAAFVAAGGSLGIGNFQGNDFWDPVLGFDAFPGVTSGTDVLCEDPGVSTAGGLAFGFNASYTEGCFVHQTYDPAFWAGKGYFALQTNGADTPLNGDWVTMATGFVDPGDPTGVPEPATLVLFGAAALAGAGLARRKA